MAIRKKECWPISRFIFSSNFPCQLSIPFLYIKILINRYDVILWKFFFKFLNVYFKLITQFWLFFQKTALVLSKNVLFEVLEWMSLTDHLFPSTVPFPGCWRVTRVFFRCGCLASICLPHSQLSASYALDAFTDSNFHRHRTLLLNTEKEQQSVSNSVVPKLAP